MKKIKKLFSAFSAKPLMLLSFFALLPTMASAQCPDNNHPHMIDLGLPSGTKWACCNVGASKPEDYGGYFAWGETTEKNSYTYDNYLHRDEEGNIISIGTDIAGTQYDAATANWGKSWVMPNVDQMNELIEKCTSEWTTENGVTGRRFTGPNGASIFMPAAGFRSGEELKNSDSRGCYYSSTVTASTSMMVMRLYFSPGSISTRSHVWQQGHPVRPVACIAIDATNFPDENFRNWVFAQEYGQDGVLMAGEITTVYSIDIESQGIADLTGIEHFTALRTLYCGGNKFTSIDLSHNTALLTFVCASTPLTSLDLSKNTALTSLSLNNNQLTSLDLSSNTALTQFYCTYTPLTSLDLSNNTALRDLRCYNNQLSSLDLSKNTQLVHAWCYNNQLTSLDVSNDIALTDFRCYNNQLSSLDLSSNTALIDLNCSNNLLTSLDVSKNKELSFLWCQNNQLTSLDLTQNAALTDLYCHNNKIKGETMDYLIASLPKLTEVKGAFCAINLVDENEENVVTKTQVAAAKEKGWTTYSCGSDIDDFKEYEGSESTIQGITIDETNFPDENFRNWVLAQDYGQDGVLTEEEIATVNIIAVGSKNISDLKGIEFFTALKYLNCEYNELTSLDVSKNTILIQLNCYNNQLTSLDFSKNVVLERLLCSSNQLTSLDVSQNKALTYLSCYYNQLTTLDVSKNTALTDLNCQENPLTSLDLSKNTALEYLSFSEVSLSSIDLSHNTALTDLSFSNTPLTSIDLSNNHALTTLSCINNDQLTSIDMTKNTALTTLTFMSNDQFTSIDVTKNTALTRLYCERNHLTSLDVSKNVALESLNCSGNQLTSLDVSKNTALTALNCGANSMTTLDVSKNVALNNLSCSDNQLTSLDMSKNIALTHLYCDNNQLSSLDVSKNTALIVLSCDGNQLNTLDVSKNTALIQFNCHDNQLTSLDLSQNASLQVLTCYYNQLKGAAMDALVESLPESEGYFYAFVPFDNKEQNVVTKAQVAAAKEKRWTTFYYDDSYGWKEYEGSDPVNDEMNPINNGETIDIGTEIDENTNLEGTVVDNVFVNISNGDGGFDPVEGCLIVSKPTDDSAINGKDIFGDDFKDNYTGIVFKVNEGKGSIKVEAETQGNMVLKVKIGNSEPIEMELDGKLKVKFPYNVSEPTYVYIYGGMGAAGAKAVGANRAKSAADLLKIYGFEVISDASGIDAIENGQPADAPVYNLNGQRVNTPGKGVYIKNGRKVLMK